jgi:hypothetical protein
MAMLLEGTPVSTTPKQNDKEKEIGNQLYLEIRKKYPIQIELEPFDAVNQEFIDQLRQKISE